MAKPIPITEVLDDVTAERDALLAACEAVVDAGYEQIYDAVQCKFCGKGVWGCIPVGIRHDSDCPVGMAEVAIVKAAP